MKEQTFQVQNLFNLQCMNFSFSEKGEQGTQMKYPVFCNDVPALMTKGFEFRNASHQHLVTIGIYVGGVSLKVGLNISELQKQTSQSPSKNWHTLDPSLDTGVKKLLHATLYDVQENYSNMRYLLEVLKLQNVKCTIAADLKISRLENQQHSDWATELCFIPFLQLVWENQPLWKTRTSEDTKKN